MRHLDERELERLEAGEPEAGRYFGEHLKSSCQPCEAFLAAHPGPSNLDGLTDWALHRTVREDGQRRLDELGLTRIRRGMRSARASRFAALTGGLAAAALVLLLALPGRGGPKSSETSRPQDGIKGTSRTLTVELQAAQENGGGKLVPVDDARPLRAVGSLVFRYYATDRAEAWLIQERAGRVEALGRFALEPGRHVLRLPSGEVASLPLEGEAGLLRLWLVASASHLPSVDEAFGAVKNGGGRELSSVTLPLQIEGSLH